MTFDWVTVGNPGNTDDIHDDGFGSVDATYRISKYEVTNAQYAEFLNAVASMDSFGGSDSTLYNPSMGSSTYGGITRSGSAGNYTYAVKPPAVGQGPGGSDYAYDNKPVVFVSFVDAMRFTNWLHNGQDNGDTESGVYNVSDGVSESRSANAKYWIPNDDEWYKAAYYDPNGGGGIGAYHDYPTSTDSRPNNNLPSADTGNSANFYDGGYTTGSSSFPMTDVGAFALSDSPYGTYDQGGNVYEWTETAYSPSFRGRVVRGGSGLVRQRFGVAGLHADFRDVYQPALEGDWLGIRVATVPEPSTALLCALAALGCSMRRRG